MSETNSTGGRAASGLARGADPKPDESGNPRNPEGTMSAEGPTEKDLFESHPDVVSGALVFKGTRIPVDAFFENLAAGLSLDDLLRNYPAIGRERAAAAILLAAKKFRAAA